MYNSIILIAFANYKNTGDNNEQGDYDHRCQYYNRNGHQWGADKIPLIPAIIIFIIVKII